MLVCIWKVLLGCDGINSLVAQWLGFEKPIYTGSWAIRAYADLENGHGFSPKARQFVGHGIRFGLIPCNNQIVHWNLTWKPSDQGKKSKFINKQLKIR